MRFPRMSFIKRALMTLGFVIICSWVWVITPSVYPSISDGMPRRHVNSAPDTRQNTPIEQKKEEPKPQDSEKSDKHSHHHSNQTLEELRKNMTLGGKSVNMSDVESIINKVNKNASAEDDRSESRKYLLNRVHQEPKYVNPHPFNYLINTRAVCKDKDVFLIVYIHTAPVHYKRRMIIRQTWGNPKYYDRKVRLVFIMGNTTDKPEVQQALLFEAEQYADIVQEDFQDTYKNLTYKGIAGLKWVSNNCQHAQFVLKSDDDIFVNMFTLIRHLSSLSDHGVENKGTLLCLVWYKMKVMREGKWKIDEDEFKEDYYPTYCSGSAFTMSIDAVIAMHNVSYDVPFFWVDDFYITGLLPLKLNGKVKHKQFMSTYVLDGRRLEEKFTGPQWFTYIFSHVHDLNAIQSVWERLVRLAKGEVVAPVKYALPGELPKEDSKPNKG